MAVTIRLYTKFLHGLLSRRTHRRPLYVASQTWYDRQLLCAQRTDDSSRIYRRLRITRNPTHTQPHYYPTWLGEGHYTLYGSRLAHNTTLDSSGKYVNNPYSWGYADNAGTDADTTSTEGNAAKCHLKISNAVHPDGTAADLQYIDFVKVQSAINYTAGALGEISTEVMGIEDENL